MIISGTYSDQVIPPTTVNDMSLSTSYSHTVVMITLSHLVYEMTIFFSVLKDILAMRFLIKILQ